MKLRLYVTSILTTAAVSLAVSPRQEVTWTAVTGPPGEPQIRLPLEVLHNEHPELWNMFLLALEALQAVPQPDPLSWYGIASIHGKAWKAWGYPQPSNPVKYGYCEHQSILFTTWHRAYTVLLDQELVKQAIKVAKSFPVGGATNYTKLASCVRFPYWDFSDRAWIGGYPPEMSDDNVAVTRGDGKTESISNPLKSYRFQPEHHKLRLEDWGDDNAVYFSNETFTRTFSFLFNNIPSRRRDLMGLLTMDNFNRFSTNHFDDPQTVPPEINSLEVVHDQVHAGINGWLSPTEFAAYHPYFHLLHFNVDRLAALWQAVHPKGLDGERATTQKGTEIPRATFGEPNPKIQDADSPLWPFRHPDGSSWTSKDVEGAGSVRRYGYYYPELQDAFSGKSEREVSDSVRELWNQLYYDEEEQDLERRAEGKTQWFVEMSFERVGTDTASVVIVVDDKDVGAVSAFHPRAKGSVQLEQHGVDENFKAYLRENLQWKVEGGQVKDLEIRVGRVKVVNGKREDWIVIPEITEGKL